MTDLQSAAEGRRRPLQEAAARIVFAGSPAFALPALEALLASTHQVVAVLTQPDRPAGRGRRLQLGPIKSCALEHGIELLQPHSLRRDDAVLARLEALAPDLMVVVAYGLLLPPALLGLPRLGCINIHASLLPRWRGAAPIQAALRAGDAQTGVAVMQLEEGLDTGPVAALATIDIQADDTAGALHDRLSVLGAELLMKTLPAILDGSARFAPQAAAGVSHAAKITKAEADIDWRHRAIDIDRQIRAFNPWPVAQTRLDGQQLRCWRARPLDVQGSGATPGMVLSSGRDGIDVQTGEGVLRLLRVQLAGRQQVDAGVFANGFVLDGKVLGA